MQLQTGLGGGFALATWPGAQGTAANPNPAGPRTAGQAAFGVTAGESASPAAETTLTLMVGAGALLGLFLLWWALPR